MCKKLIKHFNGTDTDFASKELTSIGKPVTPIVCR